MSNQPIMWQCNSSRSRLKISVNVDLRIVNGWERSQENGWQELKRSLYTTRVGWKASRNDGLRQQKASQATPLSAKNKIQRTMGPLNVWIGVNVNNGHAVTCWEIKRILIPLLCLCDSSKKKKKRSRFCDQSRHYVLHCECWHCECIVPFILCKWFWQTDTMWNVRLKWLGFAI